MAAGERLDGRGDGEQVIADVVARVDPRQLTDDLVSGFAIRWPVYRDLPSEALWGPVWESTHLWVQIVLRQIGGGAPTTADEHQRLRQAGSDEAAFGIGIDEMMRAVSLGGAVVWETVLDGARPEELPHLAPAVRGIFAVFDTVATRVASYVADGHHEQAARERAAQALYADALRGRGDPQAARDAGLELGARMRAFEVLLAGRPPREHGAAAARLRTAGVLAVTRRDRVLGLLCAEQDAGALPGPPAVVTLSEEHEVTDLAAAAESILGLADAAVQVGRTGLLGPADLVVERLLLANPHLAQVVATRVVIPLSAQPEARSADLVQTLVTFLDCDLDRRRAARELELHPSSLAYRLNRITELTGLRFDRADDLALLAMAHVGLQGTAAS